MTTHGPAAMHSHATAADQILIGLYLFGIYLGISLKLPGGIPVPQVIAGFAGMALLLKNTPRITTRHLVALIAVLVIAVLSVLTAPEYQYLGERFKGFVQFTYSLLIGYGFFLAAHRLTRRWLAGFLLGFCGVILLGCLLETTVPAFKAASDAFRGVVFEAGVYDADIRDQMLYGQVRPKLFTSEPSFVSFAYTLFAFGWYVVSRLTGKALVYVGMLMAGYFLLKGPTLVLGVGLVAVYEVLLASRTGGFGVRRLNMSRATLATLVSAALAVAGAIAATQLFQTRFENIAAGYDPSFFARIIGPPILAFDVIRDHPFTGVGLTGWEYIEGMVQQLYAETKWLAMDTGFESAAHAITNYFWLHWIFLGLFWGVAMLIAMSWYLTRIGVPSVLFCWAVWVVFGQAAGGYVDPRTWSVIALAAAISVVYEREEAREASRRPLYPAAYRQAAPRSPAPDVVRRPLLPGAR